MVDSGVAQGSSGVNKGAIAAGVVLFGLGVAAATAGVAVLGAVGASAARNRWTEWRELPTTRPPSEFALEHLKRAKDASLAGFEVWRNAPSTAPAVE